MARKKTKKTIAAGASVMPAASPAMSSASAPAAASESENTVASPVTASARDAAAVPQAGHGVRTSTFVLSVLLALLAGIYIGTLMPGLLAGTQTDTAASARQSAPQAALSGSGISDEVRGRILELERHVQHQSDDADAWIQLGNLYFDISNPPNAIRAYERALLLTPDNPDVLTDLGIMYREAGKFEMAEQSFRKAAQINPKHQNALFNRGVVLFFDLGHKDDARRIWRQLLAVNPGAKAPDGRSVSDMLKTLK